MEYVDVEGVIQPKMCIRDSPVRPPYKQDDEIFLINNDDKDFYLYDDKLKIPGNGSGGCLSETIRIRYPSLSEQL